MEIKRKLIIANNKTMAIAFYCEDEDPKMMYNDGSQAYYAAAYGYHQYNHHHQQQSQHAVAVGPQQSHHAGSSEEAVVDENNNNCALHGNGDGDGGGGGGVSGSSGKVQHGATASVHSSKRQLMRVLHQVLYRYTMEGVLGPDQSSCTFCNRIYYLFQLLY